MSKLAWVLLPLMLAAAWVGVLALRGRLPARPVLNVWFSLLLLMYVSTTAGLGIFWVANQHLPVFDWHYLFGYSTVLLLALHLAFNFRVVWRHFTAMRTAAKTVPARPTQTADRGRRGAFGLLGGLGVLAASGAAFVLGLRHGRTELRIETPAQSSGALATEQDTALAVVERFHQFSAHSRSGVLRRAPAVDWGDPPPPFKAYPGAAQIRLPAPQSAHAESQAPAAARAASADPSTAFDQAAMGALLWHTAGVSERRGGIHFRTSPSSGALFATELYVAVRAVAGVAPGLWHYDAQQHVLQRVLQGGAERAPSTAALGAGDAAASAGGDAPAHVIASAIFRRSGHKYHDRAYRYMLADLGHALENLRAAAAAIGLNAGFARQFDEARAAAALGLDEAEEGVLALIALWPADTPARNPAVAAANTGADARNQLASGWRPPSLAANAAAPLGVTDAIHRATSLRAVAEPARTASSPAAPLPSPATPPLRLPPPVTANAPMLAVIARRRSIRRFAATPVPLADLSALLDAMARRHAPLLSDAVRIDLVANAVQGVAPGAWRYEPAAHALHPRRAGVDLRGAAQRAALDQDVIGAAAVVFVLSIDHAAFAADPAGAARGYRHAFLEAGLVGERLYLEAGARGLGVCAVGAFYDDEAATLVAVDPAREWVVHFAALGVPG